MTIDYEQLSQELYENLKRVQSLIDDANGAPINGYGVTMSLVNKVLQKYEKETTRGTGKTTVLYMKAITEALENPGKSVEFIDHYPHNWEIAKSHAENIGFIINKLGYNIVVQTKGQAQVYLYNRFRK
jgi:hypothetical protein